MLTKTTGEAELTGEDFAEILYLLSLGIRNDWGSDDTERARQLVLKLKQELAKIKISMKGEDGDE